MANSYASLSSRALARREPRPKIWYKSPNTTTRRRRRFARARPLVVAVSRVRHEGRGPDGDADASRADPSEIHRGAELAEAHKATGNSAFAEGRWADAEHHYTLALETLPAPLASDAAPAADLDPDPPDSGRDASLAVAADAARPRGDRPRAVYHANRARADCAWSAMRRRSMTARRLWRRTTGSRKRGCGGVRRGRGQIRRMGRRAGRLRASAEVRGAAGGGGKGGEDGGGTTSTARGGEAGGDEGGDDREA